MRASLLSSAALALLASIGAVYVPTHHVSGGATVSAANDGARPSAERTPPGTAVSPEVHKAIDSVRGEAGRGSRWPSREGWTNARYQRAARKARNVKRNRRAQRG